MKQFYFSLIFTITSLANFAQTNFTDTKGELSITNSGQASYNLPIALPPSLKNVAPVISLTYSSGQRGGIAGQGWSINGISSITRMATRVDIDGFRDGVDFDDNDKLSLDGQRLLIKTGTYWADGSTYETEYKSNTIIELKISGTTTYFIVTSPDGSQTWYGSSGGSTLENEVSLNAWFIVKFKDSYGNYIKYNYTNFTYNNTTQKYIDNIQFSGNETQNLALINQIKFNYRTDNAARVEVDYIKGQAFYAFKILSNIQVLTNNVQFRKYVLSHQADDSGYERVSQVQEFNGANEESNPVVFGYEQTGSNDAVSGETGFNSDFGIPTSQLDGDFNGDGQMDIIANNKLYTNMLNGGNGGTTISLPFTSENSFVISTLKTNKILQKSSLLKIFNNSGNIVVNSYTLNNLNTQFDLNFTKTIQTLPYSISFSNQCNTTPAIINDLYKCG